jgi:hypothetical protein
VKIIATPSGDPLEKPYEVNLWEAPPEQGGPKAVRAPLDPAEYGVDPLAFL